MQLYTNEIKGLLRKPLSTQVRVKADIHVVFLDQLVVSVSSLSRFLLSSPRYGGLYWDSSFYSMG